MSIWHLVLREIRHRKFNFLLGLLSVAAAVACLVAAVTLLRADTLRTGRILAQKQDEVKKAGDDLEEAMRKITKGLGFNVLILPQDQDLNELHLEGALSKTMPENFAERLARSRVVTIQHLLPTVIKKVTWPERHLPIILCGVRGEVPILQAALKQPILDAVPPGKIVLGYEVQRQLRLAPGAMVTLLGREFTVHKTHEQRGTADDSTVWINLSEAQQLLGLQNLIHAILALECHCAGERIAAIRKEIAQILPGTQVIERGPPALARAEARTQAHQLAVDSLKLETENRARLHQQRERFTTILVPVVMAGAAMWVGLLALGNVRQRRSEIGILRAIGFRAPQILALFLGKALLVGITAALAGFAGGLGIGLAWGGGALPGDVGQRLIEPGLLGLAVLLAVILSVAGTWIPAVLAARQDPAAVLQEE